MSWGLREWVTVRWRDIAGQWKLGAASLSCRMVSDGQYGSNENVEVCAKSDGI